MKSPQKTPNIALPLLTVVAVFQTIVPLPAQTGRPDEIVTLDPFVVQSAPEGAYTTEEAHTGTIIAVQRDQIPFNTSVVTGELLRDLNIQNAADVSQYIAGVSRNTNPLIADEGGQYSLSYRVRGFASDPLYNGFQTGGRIMSADNLGRVEVSKGPNAVLYGQAPAGGVVNFIPNAPRFKSHASVAATAGTNDFRKASFEFGGPLSLPEGAGTAAFRLGGTLSHFEREQIFFQSDNGSLFGGFTWRPSPGVNLELRADYVRQDTVPSRTPAFVSTGAGPARVVDPLNRLRLDRNFSYNGPYSLNNLDNYLSTLYATFRLTDSLTLRLGGFYSGKDNQGLVLQNTFGLSVAETVTSGQYNRIFRSDLTRALKADVLWEGRLAGFKVDSLLGFESHWENYDETQYRTPATLVVRIPFARKPQAADYPRPPAFSQFTVANIDEVGWLEWTNVRFTQFIRSAEDRVTVMWGLARGEGNSRVKDRFRGGVGLSDGEKSTYTAGATFTLLQNSGAGALNKVVAFGNASSSFNIQRGNQQNPADFQNFPTVEALRAHVNSLAPKAIAPQEGEGFEAGIRAAMFGSKLTFSGLFFQQTNRNIARNFFVRESNVSGVTSENVIAIFQLAGGEEEAKGFEAALDWSPNKRLTLTASAQISDGQVKGNPEAPEEVGFGLVQSPERMFSFWARYQFSEESRLKGFRVGFGLSYNSPTRIRPEVGDRYRLSDHYTDVRAKIGYSFRTQRCDHHIDLNVENLFDDEYTQEDNMLSEPRMLRLTYRIDL